MYDSQENKLLINRQPYCILIFYNSPSTHDYGFAFIKRIYCFTGMEMWESA